MLTVAEDQYLWRKLCFVAALSLPFGQAAAHAAVSDVETSPAFSTGAITDRSPLPAAPSGVSDRGPPPTRDVNYIRVPFEKAEAELLDNFRKDLAGIEALATNIVLFEVKTSGELPGGYGPTLRSKLERVLLTSPRLHVKECPNCDQSRLVRDKDGQLRFEENNSDLKRADAVADEVGADHVLLAELSYTPQDLELKVKVIGGATNELLWTRRYATSDIERNKDNIVLESDGDFPGHGPLSRALIGEIAFTTELSFGIASLPMISSGYGGGNGFYPSIDLLIGEKYNYGKSRFGFDVGAIVNPGLTATDGLKPLPFGLKIAPQYRYTFNPYNTTTARYSIVSEIGGLISAGLTTAYLSVGPEISLINRFSVSVLPTYILNASVGGGATVTESPDGNISNGPSSNIGTFGGLGIMTKVNITW